MPRLCERPGCSEPGAIGYGFDADRLLVWLTRGESVAADDEHHAGVLCRRHADAMVVPIGWTLDDRRDPTPRLFRPAATEVPTRRRRAVSKRGAPNVAAAMVTASLPTGAVPADAEPADAEPDTHLPTVAEVTGAPSTADDPDATVALPWVPEFDVDDDLDGLLNADSPLLARAFRGLDRPR